MELNYELTKEDYIAFNMDHFNNSPTMRKSIFIQRYIVSLIFFLFPFLAARATDIPFMFWMITFVTTYILWVVFYPKHVEKSIKKNIDKMLGEGKPGNMFGRRSLRLTDEGIEEKSDLGEERTRWSAVERISETSDHIFVYISAVRAYIVPVRLFEGMEQKDEFLSLLCQKIK